MVNGAQFLVDLALVTGVAALTTLLCHRYRQPVVVGYLLAGVLIGPHSPILRLQSVESVQTLAELGIVFLMFHIGLEFRIHRLTRAGFAALGAAAVGIAGVVWGTLLVGGLLGWSAVDAVFMGAILAISSTVVAAKAILERGEAAQRWAELALAVLIAQDVVAVAVLAVLGGAGAQPLGAAQLLGVLLRMGAFALAALVVGLLVVPKVIDHLARRRADEVLVVTLAGLALGTAVLAVLLGFSPALGAFLMGAVVAEARESWNAAQRVLPLRDLFTAVFFVSIGMLLDPALLAVHWRPALVLGALVVVVKVALHFAPAFLLGAAPRDAFKASLALAQIGEFSFVIAALGLTLGVVSDFVLPITVAIAAASALWTPYLLRGADRAYDGLARRAPQPMRTYARLYHGWWAERAASPERLGPEARRLLARLALNGFAVVVILLGTAAASEAVRRSITVRGLSDRALALLPWVGGGILALPFAFIAVRSGLQLLGGVAGALRPATGLEGGTRRTVRTSLIVLAVALLAIPGFAAAAPFLPPLPLLLFTLGAFLGAAVVLWESMVGLHGRVERALGNALGAAPGDEELRGALDAIRSAYHWGAELASARVQPGSRADGASLRGLGLRARTGATLVAVQRAGRTAANPAADFVLEPGDVLLILGEPAQLARAHALLGGGAESEAAAPRPGGVRVAEVRIEEGSPLAGATLAESALRERTGATIVGILRGGERLANPGSGTRIESGDVLLVVGGEEEVRSTTALARANRGAAEAARREGPNV